jgi:NlpC/P60 family putative phage cell wall peptidase
MTEARMQERVTAEALTWLGTPYRHQASLKGVGCDCLGLVRGVWRALYGTEPEMMPAYTPDWAEALGQETLAVAAGRHMTAIAIDAAGPGDVLLFRWRANLPAKHAGIIVFSSLSDLRSSAPLVGSRSDLRSSSPLVAPRFIHAHQGSAVAMATLSPWWRRRTAFAFRFPE